MPISKTDTVLAIAATAAFIATAVIIELRMSGRLPAYMPHAVCWRGDNALIWSMAVGNSLIFSSYMTISWVFWRTLLVANLGRVDPIARAFGAFVFTCGLTHLVNVLTTWYGYYWLQSVSVWMCVVPSVGTALYLISHQSAIQRAAKTIFQVYNEGPNGIR